MKWGGARLKTALCYLNSVTEGGGTKMTKLNKNDELLKDFEDLYSIDISDLYFDIKQYIHNLGLDLLNQETKTANIDFLKLIFDSVEFNNTNSVEGEDEEEFIDLLN